MKEKYQEVMSRCNACKKEVFNWEKKCGYCKSTDIKPVFQKYPM